MKKELTYLLLSSVLLISNLPAQDTVSVIGRFIQGHPWTMDFGISSNLTLTTFQGATISVGKFATDYHKIRFGISVSATDGSGDHTGNNYNADTLSGRNTRTEENEGYAFEIKCQYLTYATPDAHTSMYFGVGPLAGISWSKSSREETSTFGSSQSQSTSNSDQRTSSVGVLVSVGAEWFFSEHVSLHAEYGLSAAYFRTKGESSGSSKYSYPGSPTASSRISGSDSFSNWSLSGQNVLFGLSINF